MKSYDFDILIIGEGSAGLTAAAVASGLGKKTAMADREKLGGECTWSGCIPSKALLKGASVFKANLSPGKSASKKSPATADTAPVFADISQIIDGVYNGHPPSEYEKAGITVFENREVRFLDNETVLIGEEQFKTRKVVIATGSGPAIPPIPGLDKVKYHTNQTIFSIKKAPRSMIIIGAGAIGVEMATAFANLGTEITLIDGAEQILPLEDEEISLFIRRELEKLGVKICTGLRIETIDGIKKKKVSCILNDEQKIFSADEILIAAGRKPNIENLNLDKAGVKYSKKGIETDRTMRTSAKNIYACGDVAGPYQFSHMAGYQASIAASNALLPVKRKADYSHVPWVIFSSPEMARSGLTEEEAVRKYGRKIRIFRKDYASLDRAITDRVSTGFAKVITDKRYRILGIHIAGERAGEVMHELHLAKTMGIKLYSLQNVIHAYPTYSDIVRYLAKDSYIDRIRSNIIIRIISKIRETINAAK